MARNIHPQNIRIDYQKIQYYSHYHHFISVCFEQTKELGSKNIVSIIRNILSPIECSELCDAQDDCNFSRVNLRNTNVRGCWLLKKDPQGLDPMTKTVLTGPSQCRKIFGYQFSNKKVNGSSTNQKLDCHHLIITYHFQRTIQIFFGTDIQFQSISCNPNPLMHRNLDSGHQKSSPNFQ